MDNTAKIYVGTYSKYNNGSIEGKWLDLSDYSDKAEFIEACYELHKDESDPELMFQDYENIPEQFISESHISESFWTYSEAMNELSTEEAEAFEIWVNNDSKDITSDIQSLIEDFRDAYCGHYSNGLEDYADQLIEEGVLGEIPKALAPYIDVEKFARDLELGGDYWSNDGHVFRNN